MGHAFQWLLQGPLPVDGIVHLVEALAFEFKGIVVDQWNASLSFKCVEISNGKLALTRRADIDVRNMSGVLLAVCKGHKNMVMYLTSLDSGRFASGSADCDVRIWTSSGQEVAILRGHERAVHRLCALSDGRLASLDLEGNVKVWQNDTCTTSFNVINMPGLCVDGLAPGLLAFAPGHVAALSSSLMAICSFGRVSIWNSNTGQMVKTLGTHHVSYKTVVTLSEEVIMVSGMSNGNVVYETWNTTAGQCLDAFAEHSNQCRLQAVTLPDGSVVTCSYGHAGFHVIEPNAVIRRFNTPHLVLEMASTRRGLVTLHPGDLACIWR